MKSKSLVSIDQCSKEDILRILDNARKFERNKIDYMDVSPKMVFSVATAMIPFLENEIGRASCRERV